MKTTTQILTLLTSAALFAAGCVNEEPAYKKGPEEEKPSTEHYGFLALGDSDLQVITDTATEIRPGDTEQESQRSATRTGEFEDTESYIIDIFDLQQQQTVFHKTYAEFRAEVTAAENGRWPLAVGNYRLTISSEEAQAQPAVAWNHPVYGMQRDFSIRKNETTELDKMVCKLQNIKVTLMCSADLAARLSDDTQTTVAIGAAAEIFRKGETRAAFYLPQQTDNTLTLQLQGSFAQSGKPVEFSKTITGVRAGEWRKLTLIIAHADEGNIDIDVEIDTFIQDEEIIIDGTEDDREPGLGEDPDPSQQPTITWRQYDIDQQWELTEEMQIDIDILAPAGITSFEVNISSVTLQPYLDEMGIPSTFDLCRIEGEELIATIEALGFPTNDAVKGSTSCSFTITQFVGLLIEAVPPGEHNFTLNVTDAAGNRESKTLRLKYTK